MRGLAFCDGHLPVFFQDPRFSFDPVTDGEFQNVEIPWNVLVQLYWRAAEIKLSFEYSVQITALGREGTGGFYSGSAPDYIWNPQEVSVDEINKTITHADMPVESPLLGRYHYEELPPDPEEPGEETEFQKIGFIPEQYLVPATSFLDEGPVLLDAPSRFSSDFTSFDPGPGDNEESNDDTKTGAIARNHVYCYVLSKRADSLVYRFPHVERNGDNGKLSFSFDSYVWAQQSSTLNLTIPDPVSDPPATILSPDNDGEEASVWVSTDSGKGAFLQTIPFVIRWGIKEFTYENQVKLYKTVFSSEEGINFSNMQVVLSVEKFYTYGGIYDEDTGERV